MRNKLKRREDFHSLLDSISLDIESEDLIKESANAKSNDPQWKSGRPIKSAVLENISNLRYKRAESLDSRIGSGRQSAPIERPKLVAAPSLELAEQGVTADEPETELEDVYEATDDEPSDKPSSSNCPSKKRRKKKRGRTEAAKVAKGNVKQNDDSSEVIDKAKDEQRDEEDEEEESDEESDEDFDDDDDDNEKVDDDVLFDDDDLNSDESAYLVDDLLDEDEESRLYCRGNGTRRQRVPKNATSGSANTADPFLDESYDDDQDDPYTLDESELYGEKLYYKSAYVSKEDYDRERQKLLEQDQASCIDYRCAAVGKKSNTFIGHNANSGERRRKGGVVRVFVVLVVAIIVLRYVLLRNKRKQMVESTDSIYS